MSVGKKDSDKHCEAFCLMLYQCEVCRHIEILWNSRDGVTPFIIGCTKCKGSMSHTVWHVDTRVEKLVPPDEMRIFVDGEIHKDTFGYDTDFYEPKIITGKEYNEKIRNNNNDSGTKCLC